MTKVFCQLTGQDGNAFSIMGRVSKALKQAGHTAAVPTYQELVIKGDYDNLLRVSMETLDYYNIEWE